MIGSSQISTPAVWPASSPPRLTDGTIALLNLQAQIDGLEGHGSSAEAATLIDLLILRGLILGRISDYERAAQLADRLVRDAVTDAAAYVARARTRAVFHRFSEALDDLDHADRISPQDTPAKHERAAILQALGRYDEALAGYEKAADRGGQFERAGALAGLWADCGETDAAQRAYLESLRSYRGVSPFPLALLDFQVGTMWMRHGRLDQARTCFEAAIRRVPAYAAAQGHLAEVEADLGDPETAITRLYPLAAASDDPDFAAQLARILGEMGRNDEASGWCRLAADGYDALTKDYPEAFADHAAEFWLSAGNDPEKGLRFATLNLEARKTPRAYELLAQALNAKTAGATLLAAPAPPYPIEQQPSHEGNTMSAKVIENERAAMSQHMTRQPDGPGKRIGKKGEISGIGKVAPDGAKLFRERLPQIQAEAGYWETRIGTVHDFRVTLIDNDTRILFTIVFDGDFKPYIEDILREASPWLDQIFLGVWDGFKGTKDRKSVEALLGFAFECDFFFVSNPDVTVKDVAKMQRLSKAVGELLDAAT